MNVRWLWGLAAIVAFVAFEFLGRALGQHPDPGSIFFVEMQWVNHATLVAQFFTLLGRVYVLVPICLVLVVIAICSREWRGPIVFTILATLLAWQGADYFQHAFARPRRLDWIVTHETSFSYPSSHAAIAVAFYLLWSVLLARSALAGRAVLAFLLAIIGFGIMWSRLALGAHYLTDLIGGALWGVAVVAVLAAALPINVFQGPARPSLE